MEHFTAQPQKQKADDVGMSTDTPRTDLNRLTVETLRTMKGTGTQIVLAAVCRQMERELNEANAQLAAYKKGLRVTQEMLSRICR